MKKIISVIIICLMCIALVACGKNQKTTIGFDNSIPTEVLDENLSNVRYRSSPFSISVGKLVNSAMDDYDIEYLTCNEAISKGYLTEDQIGEDVNRDKFYFAVISGETMMNPDVPYMTEYEKEAAVVWMIFDENNKLLNSGVDLCENLETCAIILMSSSY